MSFRLGHLLVEQKQLTLEQVDQAFHRQQLLGGSLDTQLLELGWMRPDALQQALAEAYEEQEAVETWMKRPSLDALLRMPSGLALQLELVPVWQDEDTLHLLASAGSMAEQWPLSYWLGQEVVLHYVPQIRVFQGLAALFGLSLSRRWEQLDKRFPSTMFQVPAGWEKGTQADAPSPSLQKLRPAREPQSPRATADLRGALEIMRSKQAAPAPEVTPASEVTIASTVSAFAKPEKPPVVSTKEPEASSTSNGGGDVLVAVEVVEAPTSLEPIPPQEKRVETPKPVGQEPDGMSGSEISEQIEAYVMDDPLPRREDSLVELDAAMLVEEESQDNLAKTPIPSDAIEEKPSIKQKASQSELAHTSEVSEESNKKNTPPSGEAKLSLPPVESLRSAFRPSRQKELPSHAGPSTETVAKVSSSPAASGNGEPSAQAVTKVSLGSSLKEEAKEADGQDAAKDEVTLMGKSSSVVSRPSGAALAAVKKTVEPAVSMSRGALPTINGSADDPKVPVFRPSDAKKPAPIVEESEPTLMLSSAELVAEDSNHTIALHAMPSTTSLKAEAADLQEEPSKADVATDGIEIDVDLGGSFEPPPSSAEVQPPKTNGGDSAQTVLDDLLHAPLHRVPQLLENLVVFGGDVVAPMLEHLPAVEVVGKNTDLEEKLERMVMVCEKIDEPVLLRLIKVLQKDAVPGRMRSLMLLGKWMSSRAISHLIRHLLHEQEPTVRRMTRKVILGYKEEGGFEKLLSFLTGNLQSGEEGRIRNALQLVEELRIVEMIPELIKLLTLKDKELRDYCLRVLRRLALQSFGLDVRPWSQWHSLQTNKSRKHWILESINHEDGSIRRMVQDDLRDEFGDDFGYDPEAAPAQRESIRKLAALWLQQR
ncbi:MAG: hypothetical protein H6727_01395 [Myxococcales bacterium]|nr:hypothetical protein [Myxococcales bacterium]